MKKIIDYILKGQKIYVGLEDSKKSWKIVVRSGRIVVKKISIEADYKILQSFFRNNFPECSITVMYEAGFRGFGLHDKLKADGWDCIVTPPHTVTQEKCSRQKNDHIDADRLAKNLENGDYKGCHIPSEKMREDRQLSRLYEQLKKDCTRISNRIRRAIEFHGLEASFPQKSAWTAKTYREAALLVPDLEVGESLKFCLQMLFNELQLLRDQQAAVITKMKEIAKSDDYEKPVRLLASAPGIGQLTAIRLALEWGDISRFRRKEEFAAFLGLIPSEYSTGESERFGHITKQGSRIVRSLLIEAAWIAVRYDPVLLGKYNRIANNSLGEFKYKKIAIVAVARKLAMRLRALLLKGEEYQCGLLECA